MVPKDTLVRISLEVINSPHHCLCHGYLLLQTLFAIASTTSNTASSFMAQASTIFHSLGGLSALHPLADNADHGFTLLWQRFGIVNLPLKSSRFTVATKFYDIRGWPTNDKAYIAWVERLKPCKGESWKAWGIYDMIEVSTKKISRNADIMLPLMYFWSTTSTSLSSLGGC